MELLFTLASAIHWGNCRNRYLQRVSVRDCGGRRAGKIRENSKFSVELLS